MENNSPWKPLAQEQLQIASRQIVLCQQSLRQRRDDPQAQLLLQNALGGIAQAWQIIDSYGGTHRTDADSDFT